MLKWVKGNAYTMIVTLSDTCITMNNSATNYFSEVRWVLVGLDEENQLLAIKPVSKADIELHLYPMEDLHKISVGNGYARITNKSLMQNIRELYGRPLDNVKLLATWNESEEMLTVRLNGGD